MKTPDKPETDVFHRLSEKEKFNALHGMVAYVRGELAANQKKYMKLEERMDELEKDNEYLKGELAGVSLRKRDDTMTTTQKFNKEMERRFAWWIWYRDKVLPASVAILQNAILLALLYLTFGKGLP